MNGLKSLNSFAEFFNSFTFAEFQGCKEVDGFLRVLFNLVNCKQSDKYRLIKLFSPNYEILNRLEMIVSAWAYIRATITRLRTPSPSGEKLFASIPGKLAQLCRLESQFQEEFFALIDKVECGSRC